MEPYLLTFLALIQFKHWYIDFVNQSTEEVHSKAIYGSRLGLWHSIKHGLGTTACICAITGPVGLSYALILGTLDSVVHYHVDWAKMNWGDRDIQTPAFWAHLGLDQMAHQLTYLGIAALTFL
jgi:hypothetical protein